MAFSKNPEQSTYSTKRFNFIGSLLQRSGTSLKDQRFLNVYPEVVKTEQLNYTQNKKYFLRKRPGMVASSTPATSGAGRGCFYFDGNLYTAVGTKLYKNNTALSLTLTGSTGRVGFTQGDGTYKYLFVCDGTAAWVIKTDGTITPVVATDFPTPHIPCPIFMDGYIVLIKAASADIHNSNLDDPTLWTAGDFCTAEMTPDNVVALIKNNNYFFALGETSLEYFYDAANASASPFSRNDSGVKQLGCVAANAVVQSDKQTIFVGAASTGGRSVWIIEGFKEEDVATESIRMILDAEGATISSAQAFSVRVSGHAFYVLNLSTRTLVYDLGEKFWHEWDYDSGVFPFNHSADNPTGSPYLLNKTTGYVVTLSDGSYQDIGVGAAAVTINCVMTTARMDFESFNRKTCHRLSLLGDVPNDSADTIVYISYSDDDYKTFSSERSLLFNTEMSTLTQLGQFRRRAFRLRYAANYALRLEGIEVDINMGTQ